ncbi:MAG TPA: efflux RND transporter periplasmic adaptor subunit [Flavobacterium sp.]|jgi:membrane fusion protein (multidrug efflux system)|nr:efflux RND transporter periplasmic adaptor subunit [Flavobacterium sp.]HQV35137.1 efflux RND transporter periplasmic adaptor subunit [Flavobacterium sp.]HQX02973.1 efflux RND transporter periplasmic adaptor subunit [Flavobacterium sp.]HRZ31384.1 efflux RND transporter periplasmic adaptor subunit [Flavobacterium sp.]HRZ74120.1 efflux RND transporter periplasmic adaptor subunit [Flavobacterium sp.]
MKFKNIFIIILSVGLLTLIVYRITSNKSQSEKNNSKSASPKMAANVKGLVLTPQKFSNELTLSGTIDANEQIELRSEVSGVVQGIFFKEGQNVTKGQQLIKVNDIELRAQLSQAKTRQSLASENERRAKLLLEKEAISQEEYDVAKAELQSTQAQTQLIQAQIAKTSIVAPFSGKIGLRSISPGTYVTPTTLIAKLVNNAQVKITFSIPEKYATLMKLNSDLSFTTSGSNEKFSGKIYAMEPAIEQSTRTLQIRALADNKQGRLIPGTYANITLPLDDINDALLVPTEAIIPIQNGKKVFISSKGMAKEVIIETESRTEKEILVTAGLKLGDTVIISGIMALKEGAPLNVTLPKN